jgi:SAM-dependent methyltransferase
MAIGPDILNLYTDLIRSGIFCRGQSICELGSQDLMDNENYKDASLFKVPLHGSSREFMTALGFTDYTCIDYDGRHGAIRLNLNAAEHHHLDNKTFDVVTNLGTAEHVFNQANCFKLIHDLTKVDGIMIHVGPKSSPRPGWDEHGLYLYTHNLFQDLARANYYIVLRLYDVQHRDGTLVMAVMKRKSPALFTTPIQGMYTPMFGDKV